jgi:hypothetical protein
VVSIFVRWSIELAVAIDRGVVSVGSGDTGAWWRGRTVGVKQHCLVSTEIIGVLRS